MQLSSICLPLSISNLAALSIHRHSSVLRHGFPSQLLFSPSLQPSRGHSGPHRVVWSAIDDGVFGLMLTEGSNYYHWTAGSVREGGTFFHRTLWRKTRKCLTAHGVFMGNRLSVSFFESVLFLLDALIGVGAGDGTPICPVISRGTGAVALGALYMWKGSRSRAIEKMRILVPAAKQSVFSPIFLPDPYLLILRRDERGPEDRRSRM